MAKSLTPRQRQSQQIMREKAARKKRKILMRKLAIAAGGLWAWKSGAAVRTATATVNGAYLLTARAGFSVQALYLEGRNRTSMNDIEKALEVKKGTPILQLSLDDMRDRLEKIESVKFAAVERALPGTLYVRIVEREPAALWQHQGKLAAVDDNGVVMNDIDLTPYKHLPLIIGDDAPTHISELLSVLASAPDLAKRFVVATRMGDRRWDIRLNGQIGVVDVKLPEDDPTTAWKKLSDLEQRDQVLERDVKVIDLRLEGRMFIKVAPGLPGGKPNARET